MMETLLCKTWYESQIHFEKAIANEEPFKFRPSKEDTPGCALVNYAIVPLFGMLAKTCFCLDASLPSLSQQRVQTSKHYQTARRLMQCTQHGASSLGTKHFDPAACGPVLQKGNQKQSYEIM